MTLSIGKNLEFEDHPFASIFPLIEQEALERLADDIKANGLAYPITVFEGKILDGRNRYRACKLGGVEVRFVVFDGDDPVSFVISSNALRRDLTKSQRAAAAVNCEEIVERLKAEAEKRREDFGRQAALKQHGRVVEIFPLPNSDKTRDQLAKLFGCNERYIQDAFAIKALGAAIDELSESKEPEWREVAEQHKSLRDLFTDVLNDRKSISDANRERERFEYDKRVAAAAIEKRALPQVILADPPWQYDSQTTTPDRKIENQYETLSLDDIKAQVPIPAPDAVLFLWATAPLLPEALEVLQAWGFVYKTCAVWDKEAPGLGYWFRIQHELLLVGVRGKMSPPAEFLRVSSVFRSKRGRHSEKPEEVAAWIEKAFPAMRKLEMYARKKREGWTVLGNEV